jgi:hypothetical protein
MYLFVEGPVRDLSESDLAAEDISRSVEHICMAVREGHHLLSGDPMALDALTKATDITASSRAILRQAIANFSSLAPLRDKVEWYGSISLYPEFSHSNTFQHRIIHIPIRKFKRSALAQNSVLICEDLNDADAYRLLGRIYQVSAKLEKLVQQGITIHSPLNINESFESIHSIQVIFASLG